MIKTVDAQTLHNWLTEHQALLIDVREADEYRVGHIPFACSLPLSNFLQDMPKFNIPPQTRVVFQCLSGKRGEKACNLLQEIAIGGGCEVYNLAGGITGWKESHFPVVGSASRLTIFRQVQIIIGSLIAICVAFGFLVATGFFVAAGILAMALAIAGITGWCGLALLLEKMPWNKN